MFLLRLSVSRIIWLWVLWTSAVALLLATSLVPLVHATSVSPALFVFTPLGTATGWAGVAFAAAQIVVVFFTPIALFTLVWARSHRGGAA